MMRSTLLYLFTCLSIICLDHGAVAAEDPPFSPVWKLMANRDKEQFVAGYLRGWQEASGVTSIVLEHVKQNPHDATKSIEKLRDVLSLPQAPAAASIIRAIDKHYADPRNAGDSLYLALNAAR